VTDISLKSAPPLRMGRWSLRKPSVLPGFGLTLGFTLCYLSLIVLIPLAGLILAAAGLGWSGFWSAVTTPRVLSAFRVSFGTSLIAAVINAFFGLMVAWVLVRYSFPGKRIVDAIVDLPFALPTAVAGIALTSLYTPNGWIGSWLEPLGIKVAFTPLGIIIALTFIGLPFVVRTVQPVLQDLAPEEEEAAVSLGATREFGSVIFIAGNMPGISEIIPLLIIIKLEQFDYAGATAIATLMLLVSFAMLLAINVLQAWMRSRHAG
jgi:sulfate transport system permease protein